MVEHVAITLAKETMDWNEPIPEFQTRYPNVLESCLTTPFQKVYNQVLYKGLVAKCAILFYLLVKNHPFQNGNKRMAVTILLIFLLLNKKWLYLGSTKLYNLARVVAASKPQEKDATIHSLKIVFRKFIKKIHVATI